jgi:hypothetical protein
VEVPHRFLQPLQMLVIQKNTGNGSAFILTAEQTNGNESHSRLMSQTAAGFCYDIHPAANRLVHSHTSFVQHGE